MKDDKVTNTATDITVAVIILGAAIAFLAIYFEDAISLYRRFLEWFWSFEWGRFKSALFIIFAILDFILLGFMVWLLRRYSKLDKATPPAEVSAAPTVEITPLSGEVSENWERIRELANSSSPSDWNMAIIRADALLDDVLAHLGYEGESLFERLKIADPTKLKSLDRVYSAHRLRNMIAHDPLVEQTKENIIHALRSYQEAFKELGVLE